MTSSEQRTEVPLVILFVFVALYYECNNVFLTFKMFLMHLCAVSDIIYIYIYIYIYI